MKSVCSYCQTQLGDVPDFGDPGESGGVCLRCAVKQHRNELKAPRQQARSRILGAHVEHSVRVLDAALDETYGPEDAS